MCLSVHLIIQPCTRPFILFILSIYYEMQNNPSHYMNQQTYIHAPYMDGMYGSVKLRFSLIKCKQTKRNNKFRFSFSFVLASLYAVLSYNPIIHATFALFLCSYVTAISFFSVYVSSSLFIPLLWSFALYHAQSHSIWFYFPVSL